MTSGMMERSQVVPNVYQGYYQEGYRDIVKEADERYMSNLSAWQLFLYEQIIDRKFYLGDQRYINLYSGLSYTNQKYIFNPVMPVINTICGRQRQHRKATQILPTHGSSNKTASQATKAIQCVYKNDKTYHKISDCFKESAGITGLALLHSFMDYRKDPICGDLATEVLTADMLMMDAFWREKNLTDCQFIRTRKYLWRQQVKQMIPGREHDIDMLNDQAYFDTKFTFMPQQYNIRRKGFLAYDEYWYLAERMATFIVDPQTYESTEIEFDKQDLENLKNQFPHIVVVKQEVPTVRLAIIVNNTCFYDGPNPLGIDMYPYTAFVGYHDLANNNYAFRYQGATRNIRDPAHLYSYRKQLELDLLAAQFSGVDVEEDALIDDQDAFKVGPGKVRFFKKNRMQALVDKPGAVIHPGNFQATQYLKEDVQSNAGVTPELLGQAEDSDVGITEQLKQGAALTTLQELFDNVDLSQCHAGELHWEIIQKNYTLGKIRKMIEEEPTNEFRDKSFQKYEAAVTQAPLTATTQQLGLAQLLGLQERGIKIPPSYLMKNIVIQDKDKLIEEVEQAQQAQQEQEKQMAQLQIENQTIVNDSLKSKAMSDRALAEERIQKGHLEQVQIVTAHNKAEHEKASATLNMFKAAKEVQSAHVEDFVKVLTLIENIQKRQDESSLKQQEVENAQP